MSAAAAAADGDDSSSSSNSATAETTAAAAGGTGGGGGSSSTAGGGNGGTGAAAAEPEADAGSSKALQEKEAAEAPSTASQLTSRVSDRGASDGSTFASVGSVRKHEQTFAQTNATVTRSIEARAATGKSFWLELSDELTLGSAQVVIELIPILLDSVPPRIYV